MRLKICVGKCESPVNKIADRLDCAECENVCADRADLREEVNEGNHPQTTNYGNQDASKAVAHNPFDRMKTLVGHAAVRKCVRFR